MGKDQELLEAARNGNVTIVEKILGQRAKRSGPLASLRRGPGANVQDASGYSALHYAALNGHRDVVKVLLQYEASTNVVDSKGSSPLHLAAWAGDAEIVKLILSQGPSVPNVNLATKDNETALHCAAQYGHTEVVAQLLQYGCDPSIRNSRGESALDLAAQYGRLETVQLLVKTHPELIESLRSSSSSLVFPHTPLHLASRNGHRAVVEVLLASGVDVNTRTSSGTAMHEAALCGKMEVVRALLDRGVDLSIRDSHDNTVFDLLNQFPSHVTHDITAIIKKHLLSEENNSLIHEGNNSLDSSYENFRSGDDYSPVEGSSPTQWKFYHKPRDDHRRISGTSVMSLGSDGGSYQMPQNPRYLEACSYASEDLSLTMLPSNRELDQLSISSSSSTGGPSPRDKRCLPNDSGIYLPMAPLSSSLHSTNNKISPTPPKKPPRRNLSASPTHSQSQMAFSADSPMNSSNYEYLFLAKSGTKSHIDLKHLPSRREQILYATRSVDQYVDMKARSKKDNKCTDSEPIALTAVYGDTLIKLQNPRRKLRRYCDKAYENYEIEKNHEINDSPSSENAISLDQTFVSNAFLTLKSSQESLQDRQNTIDSCHGNNKSIESLQVQFIPTSPTHYVQPPTPDHPPPSALYAEKSIHDRIRPLSQVYQRRSRDMETETDEDLLQFQPSGSLDASSGSLSSVSLSDKSMSTDNVEEFFGDAPFAGLLKGSITAERPQTLQRLKNFYSHISYKMGTGADLSGEKLEKNIDNTFNSYDKNNKTINIKSPTNSFDEQEEWAKISEIMASFGTGLVRESVFISELENEFQSRLGFGCDSANVGKWLSSLGLADYKSLFINYGYDDLDFINGILVEGDLKDMGITNDQHIVLIMEASLSLNKSIENKHLDINNLKTLDEWLKSINLDIYLETFKKHLCTDMERIKKIWEVELVTVLEIQKPAHRKRILMSVNGSSSSYLLKSANGSNLEDINKDLTTLKSNIQQLKDEIRDKLPEVTKELKKNYGTLSRHRKNRPAPQPPQRSTSYNGSVSAAVSADHLEIRAPSELFFGVPSTLKTEWRHQPQLLVTGSITYIVNYLGSTVVKELRGTESTKKSIQKLKKTSRDPKINLAINLSISYRGVRFLDALTNEPICDHEIRNIHCACQDADDLTHFAYITKDHTSPTHFCHVFCVPSMDQATEIILTLGEAFEVAYQMVLKDKNYQSTGNQLASCTNAQSNSTNATITTTTITTTTITTTTTSTINNSVKVQNNNNNINNDITDGCANVKKTDKIDKIYSNKTDNNNITENSTNSSVQIKSKTNATNLNSNSINISLKTINYNTQSNSTVESSNSNSNNSNSTIVGAGSNCTFGGNSYSHPKPLVTHGRSHSVNDIKINGNQLKVATAPVDDISIGVKDMKAGSRAPIAFSEEL